MSGYIEDSPHEYSRRAVLKAMSDSSEINSGKSYGNSDNILPYDICLNTMLSDSFLCDVTIRVDDYTKAAHRVILSAASSYFRELLKNDVPPKQLSRAFDMTDIFINSENLDQILMFIYDGHVILTDKNVTSLLKVNKVLCVSSLDNQCAQFLLSKLRPFNALDTWEIAWKYDLQELLNISLILCRETVSDLLLLSHNITNHSEEFMSMVIANKEVMTTVKPDTMVRMLLWWTTAQKFPEGTDKADKFLFLLEKYFDWKTLSEFEFQSIEFTICQCSEDFPDLARRDTTSWLNNCYRKMKSDQLSGLPESDEDSTSDEISGEPEPMRHQQDWSLLVAEKDFQNVGIFCNTRSTWFTIEFDDVDPSKVLGFFDNSLVLLGDCNTLILRDVDTMDSLTLSPPTFSDSNLLECMGAQNSTFFMHANSIYDVAAVTYSGKDLVCVIHRWNHESGEWASVLELAPEFLSNDILSVSLKVETSYGDSVYLFITVKRLHANRPGPRLNMKPGENNTCGSTTTSAFSGSFVTTSTEENSTVCMKPLEMFYVYCINMKDFNYRQIGQRQSEPVNLNLNRKIILEDRIIFLLDLDKDMDGKFRYAYYHKIDCFLSGLSLSLYAENHWTNMTLRAPLPEIRDISIRKRDRICLDSVVTTCKNLLFVGTHWSPHVFQVIMYDLSTYSVSALPPIPLPAIRHMSIYPLHTYQPIGDFLTEETRTVDLLGFHFKDWSLNSWEGASV